MPKPYKRIDSSLGAMLSSIPILIMLLIVVAILVLSFFLASVWMFAISAAIGSVLVGYLRNMGLNSSRLYYFPDSAYISVQPENLEIPLNAIQEIRAESLSKFTLFPLTAITFLDQNQRPQTVYFRGKKALPKTLKGPETRGYFGKLG